MLRSMVRILVGLTVVGGMLSHAGPAAAATISVTTTLDEHDVVPDATCSLREAITAANTDLVFGGCLTGAGDDTIQVPPGIYTLTIVGDTVDNVDGDLDIVGGGGGLVIQSSGGSAQDTIIEAGTTGVSNGVAGNGIDRVIHVVSGGSNVTLRDLTIRNGREQNGTGGGGISSDADGLTLERVAVRASSTIAGAGGGGIWADGNLFLSQSEVSGNLSLEDGGGIYQFDGNLFADNTTISGNRAAGSGGGIAFEDGFHALAGVTVANNMADSDNAGGGSGGGLFQTGTADPHVAGSIIADNTVGTSGASPDCAGGFNSFGAFGGNVVENATGCPGFEAGDVGIDPQLMPLAANAPGTTMSHAIAATSPAVDRWPLDGGAEDDGCQLNVGKFGVQPTDQRGVARPQGGACDSGALELTPAEGGPPPPPADPVPGVCKGKTATITGTDGADNLKGTKGNDIFAGLAGNDTFNGRGGKDVACGGDGNDVLKGSKGNDKLFGEKGNDKLAGGAGNDKMIGGGGKDKLKGAAGNDKMNGGGGKDTCAGGGGDKDKAKKCEKVSGVP